MWFAPSLAVVMPDGLTEVFDTTFFVVFFLAGCFEFAFMVNLLSLFFLFSLDRLLLDRDRIGYVPSDNPLRI